MARCLIIGCGCRGRSLGRALLAGGHAVRGTTRSHARLGLIEEAGLEAHLGDPDRIATIAPAFEHVTVACVLLGSAAGSEAGLRALHGTRLAMLLARLLDTTVRGVVYEGAGSVDTAVLEGGARTVREVCEDSRIPYAVLRAAPDDPVSWVGAAAVAVGEVLGSR